MQQEENKAFSSVYLQVLTSPGKAIRAINRIVTKNGSYVWLEGILMNLLQDNTINAIVANYRDITEEKIAEEKITNPDGSTSTKRSVSGCSTQEAQEQFAALRDQSSTAPASVPSPISTANAAEVEGQTQGKNVAPKANEGGKKTPDATGDKTVPKCRVQLKAVGTDVNLKTDTGCDVSVHVSAPPS